MNELDLPGLDDPGLIELLADREQTAAELFGPLLDPTVAAEDAARAARIIAVATFDQGCCGPETPAVIRALIGALAHPGCRAPATILTVLGNYLFDNAEQSDDTGPSDELFEGMDVREPRWARFRPGAELEFLHAIHAALGEGVPVYLAMLEHEDPSVRQAAAFALAPHHPAHDVRAQLEARLETESDAHALAALILTWALQQKYAGDEGELATRWLTDERLVVRVAAAIALANHGHGSDDVLAILEEGSRAAELPFARGERGVSLGNNNLRRGATRALARSGRRFAPLADDTIVARDSFQDSTVARVAAEELLQSVEIPKSPADATGEARAILEAIAQHPGSFSRTVRQRLGGPLELARQLGLRPATQLVGELAERVVASVVGAEDLGEAAELAEGLGDADRIDLVEDLFGQAFGPRLRFEWPPREDRTPEIMERVRAEGARRDARALLLGFRILESVDDVDVLARRAAEATGDRTGIQRPLAVVISALAARGGPLPESCSRVLRHLAHVPELVPHVRAFLERQPVEDRTAALTGWEAPATCFYSDLLAPEGLVKIARSYNYWIDETHAVPFLERLASEDPALLEQVIDAVVERQTRKGWAKQPGAVRRTLTRADGTTVEVWGYPTPMRVNELKSLWP